MLEPSVKNSGMFAALLEFICKNIDLYIDTCYPSFSVIWYRFTMLPGKNNFVIENTRFFNYHNVKYMVWPIFDFRNFQSFTTGLPQTNIPSLMIFLFFTNNENIKIRVSNILISVWKRTTYFARNFLHIFDRKWPKNHHIRCSIAGMGYFLVGFYFQKFVRVTKMFKSAFMGHKKNYKVITLYDNINNTLLMVIKLNINPNSWKHLNKIQGINWSKFINLIISCQW